VLQCAKLELFTPVPVKSLYFISILILLLLLFYFFTKTSYIIIIIIIIIIISQFIEKNT